MASPKKAFSLIEILIVVAILSIIAVIAIPTFSGASDEALGAAMRKDLQMIRNQIEIYKIHHIGVPPGYIRTEDGSLSDWDGALFVQQLIGSTDLDGYSDGEEFGPYMKRFPSNPFVKDDNLAVQVRQGMPTGEDEGWSYDPPAGKFYANDSDAEHQEW